MTAASNRQPIGYWVKLLDQRIEGSFEATLAAEGLVRRHWQVLNVVKDRPATPARIAEELAPFLDDASPFIGDLRQRGWVTASDEGCEITATGRDAYERLQKAVQANRARITDGLTEEQYRTTVDTLERMCANLVLPCATSSSPPTPSGSASS